MSEDTYYTALGVAETATGDEIKSSYRSLLKRIHPDTVSTLSEETRRRAEEATREMNEAYSVLSDPRKRAEYDLRLAEQRNAKAENLAPLPDQSRGGNFGNSNGSASADAIVPHKRRRRRRRHRSRGGRYFSQREHARSLFRPVSVSDWLVLSAYIFLAVVLAAIAVVVISSASQTSEDSAAAPLRNDESVILGWMNGAGYGDRTRDIELGKLAFYR